MQRQPPAPFPLRPHLPSINPHTRLHFSSPRIRNRSFPLLAGTSNSSPSPLWGPEAKPTYTRLRAKGWGEGRRAIFHPLLAPFLKEINPILRQRSLQATLLAPHPQQPFRALLLPHQRPRVTTPWILRRILHHTRSHRIQINVARHHPRRRSQGRKILDLHRHAAVAVLPQCPLSPIPSVIPAAEALLQRPHEQRQIPHAFGEPLQIARPRRRIRALTKHTIDVRHLRLAVNQPQAVASPSRSGHVTRA